MTIFSACNLSYFALSPWQCLCYVLRLQRESRLPSFSARQLERGFSAAVLHRSTAAAPTLALPPARSAAHRRAACGAEDAALPPLELKADSDSDLPGQASLISQPLRLRDQLTDLSERSVPGFQVSSWSPSSRNQLEG